MRSINKGGQVMMINLLMLVMTIAVLIVLAPAINDFLNIAKQSDSLNCAGYIHEGNTADVLSYNSSLNTETLGCLGLSLYLPYIIIAVLVMGVGSLGVSRVMGGSQIA